MKDELEKEAEAPVVSRVSQYAMRKKGATEDLSKYQEMSAPCWGEETAPEAEGMEESVPDEECEAMTDKELMNVYLERMKEADRFKPMES